VKVTVAAAPRPPVRYATLSIRPCCAAKSRFAYRHGQKIEIAPRNLFRGHARGSWAIFRLRRGTPSPRVPLSGRTQRWTETHHV